MAWPAGETYDFPLALAAGLEEASHTGGAGLRTGIIGPQIADTYSFLHEPAQAARFLAASDPNDPTTMAEAPLLAGYAALDRGDLAAAAAPLEACWKAWLADPLVRSISHDNPCIVGLAYGLTGRMAQAEAVFKQTGSWSRCFAVHGDVLEHAGDLAGAERLWARGIALAPDLPPVYLHRGISELNRGDLARAGADVAAANARAPHWADPLKAWGDLLAREGPWKDAVAK